MHMHHQIAHRQAGGFRLVVVAAGLVGWLVFKERLRPLALVGAAVAVVGIALLRLG